MTEPPQAHVCATPAADMQALANELPEVLAAKRVGEGAFNPYTSSPYHFRSPCSHDSEVEKLNPGVSKPGGFPLFRERSRLCCGPFRDCSAWVLFLGQEEERDESGKSPKSPRANRETPRKIGKVPKRTKKEGQVHFGKPPPV